MTNSSIKEKENLSSHIDSYLCCDLQSGGGIHEFSDSQFGEY